MPTKNDIRTSKEVFMGTEIERKFIVVNKDWVQHRDQPSRLLEYGYLESPSASICIRRIVDHNTNEGRINIKSKSASLSRNEHEAKIPAEMAEELIQMYCKDKTITKVRHFVGPWEIDEFLCKHAGLVMAEIELPAKGAPFTKRGWLGQEVTGIPEYYNEHLAEMGEVP
jgi:CYTH domain-containing protein